ncbi:MAG TPA: hypothetical protein VLF67_03530 [Candidatus Saccharimonas sp.]|nr:hypothetical protein [Candidatus Saccharimonas sp.]
MNSVMDNNGNTRKPRTLVAALASVVVLLALLEVLTIWAFIVPAQVQDGTSKYTGVEADAARHAIAHAKNNTERRLVIIPEQFQVLDVQPNASQTCTLTKPGPADIGYYDVTIKAVWLFGISHAERYQGCILQNSL